MSADVSTTWISLALEDHLVPTSVEFAISGLTRQTFRRICALSPLGTLLAVVWANCFDTHRFRTDGMTERFSEGSSKSIRGVLSDAIVPDSVWVWVLAGSMRLGFGFATLTVMQIL